MRERKRAIIETEGADREQGNREQLREVREFEVAEAFGFNFGVRSGRVFNVNQSLGDAVTTMGIPVVGERHDKCLGAEWCAWVFWGHLG